MALRNVFGAQSIRQKLLLGTLFLAIIPVAVTSVIVGRESLVSGRNALEAQAREALVAQRATKAAQVTDYFATLSNQVQVLAASPEFARIAANPLDDGSRSSLAISDGQIFARTFSRLYCIGQRREAKEARRVSEERR